MPPTTRTGLKKRYTFYSGDKHRAKAKILQDQSKRMKSKYEAGFLRMYRNET